MAVIDGLWLARLTKNEDDAGSFQSHINLTVNIDGEDIADLDFSSGPDEGQADIDPNTIKAREVAPFESTQLTNSSIRLGIRGDDAWGPQHVLLMGRTERQVLALAMETDLEHWLSTDSTEGHLTMPVRLVSSGSSSTVIRRVLLLVYTYTGSNVETDSPIELQITAAGNNVLQQQIPDTSQDDLEQYRGNWYVLDAAVPFTRGDVLSNGGIRLRILGDDAWLPHMVFVYGLDTADGRPNEVVTLVSLPEWNMGWLSTDPHEGKASVDLPVI